MDLANMTGRLELREVGNATYLPQQFQCVGDSYYPSQRDQGVTWFLGSLVRTREIDRLQNRATQSFLPLRDDFRRIIKVRPIPGLVWCLANSSQIEERRLAAWLLGMCQARVADSLLLAIANHSHDRLRFEVLRSLRRLGRHRELRRVRRWDLSERERRIVEAFQPRDFGTALARLRASSTADFPVPRRPFELFVPISPTVPHRPKSRELIRRILERIRFLLRGMN
jgi:hypothetical protein